MILGIRMICRRYARVAAQRTIWLVCLKASSVSDMAALHRYSIVWQKRRDEGFSKVLSCGQGVVTLSAQQHGYKREVTRLRGLVFLALTFLFGAVSDSSAADEASLWRALASTNHFAVLRHAIAPGAGDPREFTIGDCRTQRNLSDAGRRQAGILGQKFRESGIHSARVYSSQWCRSKETAALLGLGYVTEMPVLNSFFQSAERGPRQTQALKSWLADHELVGPVVLVTHQVNITALTGLYTAPGELVVIRRTEAGKISVVGSIRSD